MAIRVKIICCLCCVILAALSFHGVPAFAQQLTIDEPIEMAKLNQRFLSLYSARKYTEAIPLGEKLLDLMERGFGPETVVVATTRMNLADMYLAIDNYKEAEHLYKQALGVLEKTPGHDHQDIVDSALSNLADLYRTLGRDGEAEPLYLRARAITEKNWDAKHLSLESVSISGRVLNNMAVLYRSRGQYDKALPLYQRALAIYRKAFGPKNQLVAKSLDNLALLYAEIGDYAKAEDLSQQALAIFEELPGTDRTDVALALNSKAERRRAVGEAAKAEPLYQQALEILGLNHPQTATVLNNLAGLYQGIGENTKALPLFQKALDITQKRLGQDHPEEATILNNIAVVHHEAGQHAKADALYRNALAIKEKAFGTDHPEVAIAHANLASIDAAQNNYRDAFLHLKSALSIQEKQIQSVFTITTEPQKLKFIQLITGNYFAALSIMNQHLSGEQETVRESFEFVLRRKGIVLEAESLISINVQRHLSVSDRKDWDRLVALRTDWARLLLSKPEKMSADVYRERLASLSKQSNEIEERLVLKYALLADTLKQRGVTIEDVFRSLPKRSALVDFVKGRDYDFSQRQSATDTWRYLAFVVPAAGQVELVDLGDAATIDAAAQRMLRGLRRFVPRDPVTSEEAYQSLKEFYSMVWAPLEKFLGSATITEPRPVVISPDGVLNLVPFAALMDGEGRSLVERYRIAYVTSGRELVGSVQGTVKPESDLLLVAHPAYDLEIQKTATPVSSSPPLRSREVGGALKFRPLPGTAREALDIPPLVTGQEERKRAVLDVNATEAAVKTSRSPRILHLATHGFFLQDMDLSLDESKRGTTGRYENQLVRSGLALAGANRAAEITEGEDGLLTALEVTGMDLHGTELVVLSACETGVGDVQNGEGVFGLRRAFALAGTKNLLMSLWKVDDDATAQQMAAFYQNLQKMPPAEALRQAQLETIKKLKKRDGIASPTLWAPFILQGAHALGP